MLGGMSAANQGLAELENWEILRTFLPPEWAEQARRLGAMRRARYISDPETVLRVLLLHLATGCSLAETAARASASGLAQISAVGVFKRLRAAEPWVRWLAQQMRGAAELPMAVAGRRVRAIDATSVSEPGSTGTDWKVHWAVNLADLQCDFFELTDIHQGGETFRRVPVVAGDIVMGDRVYAAPPGVAHIVRRQGDVVVRLNRQALPLFEGGRRMELLPFLRGLKGKTPQVRATRGARSAGRVDQRAVDRLAPERGGDTPGAAASASAGAARTRQGIGRGVGIRRLLHGLDHLEWRFLRRRDSRSVPAALAD